MADPVATAPGSDTCLAKRKGFFSLSFGFQLVHNSPAPPITWPSKHLENLLVRLFRHPNNHPCSQSAPGNLILFGGLRFSGGQRWLSLSRFRSSPFSFGPPPVAWSGPSWSPPC